MSRSNANRGLKSVPTGADADVDTKPDDGSIADAADEGITGDLGDTNLSDELSDLLDGDDDSNDDDSNDDDSGISDGIDEGLTGDDLTGSNESDTDLTGGNVDDFEFSGPVTLDLSDLEGLEAANRAPARDWKFRDMAVGQMIKVHADLTKTARAAVQSAKESKGKPNGKVFITRKAQAKTSGAAAVARGDLEVIRLADNPKLIPVAPKAAVTAPATAEPEQVAA